MIEKLFQSSRAPFVIVRDGQLHIGDEVFDHISAHIHEVHPVRKLFQGRTLQCFSLDCRTGKKGKLCELCSDRQRCGQRLQLRLVYRDQEQDHPAILELPRQDFRAFDKCLEEIGDLDGLEEVLIAIHPIKNEKGWTSLHFQLLF